MSVYCACVSVQGLVDFMLCEGLELKRLDDFTYWLIGTVNQLTLLLGFLHTILNIIPYITQLM